MPSIPRRVVTGHDERGVSVFASDGPVPVVRTAPDGALFYEIWGTGPSDAKTETPRSSWPVTTRRGIEGIEELRNRSEN